VKHAAKDGQTKKPSMSTNSERNKYEFLMFVLWLTMGGFGIVASIVEPARWIGILVIGIGIVAMMVLLSRWIERGG
jgi:hypothetical protein